MGAMRVDAEPMTGREVGFRVFSNEVHDWPGVEAQLSKEHQSMLNGLGDARTLTYFPCTPTREERAQHGWHFADLWVWSSTTSRPAGAVAPV